MHSFLEWSLLKILLLHFSFPIMAATGPYNYSYIFKYIIIGKPSLLTLEGTNFLVSFYLVVYFVVSFPLCSCWFIVRKISLRILLVTSLSWWRLILRRNVSTCISGHIHFDHLKGCSFYSSVSLYLPCQH